MNKKTLGPRLDKGEKILSSMGDFISLLVDGGNDHIVFGILEDSDYGDGTFRLKFEVDVVPEKHILDFCDSENIKAIHGRISEAIERGIITRSSDEHENPPSH